MVNTSDFDSLKSSVMLQDFTSEDLAKLARLCESRMMEKGTTVFIENMPGESLFLIKKGSIKISNMFAEGDEKTLVVLGPADIFGEMAIIDGLPRTATARVAEDTELISLKKTDFEQLCKNDPAVALKMVVNIVRMFTKQIREANKDYREMLAWSMQTEEKAD